MTNEEYAAEYSRIYVRQDRDKWKDLFELNRTYYRPPDTNAYGELLTSPEAKKVITWDDVALGLERAIGCTNDSRFSVALNALREYGLTGQNPGQTYQSVYAARFSDPQDAAFAMMQDLVARGCSERLAAEQVAAEHWHILSSASFESVTAYLRKNYKSK